MILYNTVKQIGKTFCSLAVMLAVFMAGITAISAKALDNGIYIADCTPHYAHPVTGEIEDSGGDGSSVLGQSMTESATNDQALIEVDPDGNMYATVRLKLMDNIQNPQFKVQENGSASFYDVDYDIMKEDYDNNESDFRFQIPNEGCIVRCTFYVIAMGRDVIFYIDFSDLSEGSGDFITSVEVRQPEQPQQTEQPRQTQPPQQDEPQQTNAPINQTENSSVSTSAAATTKKTVSASSVPSTETTLNSEANSSQSVTTTADDMSYSIPEAAENKADGIACFDENGDPIDPLGSSRGNSKTDNSGNSGSAAVPLAIAGGAVVVAGAAGGIVFWKKRRSI